MDKTKWLLIACTLVMTASLLFSAASVTLLLNMEREMEDYEEEIEETIASVSGDVSSVKQSLASILTAIEEFRSNDQNQPETEAGVLFDRLCIRASDGKIGVYTEDGFLIRTIDVSIDTLPESDREALKTGITINSWRELIALIEDFA